MLTLDDSALEALTKKGAKIVVKNTPAPAPVVAPPSELAEILKTMVSILNRPVERNVTPAQPAPNVTVLPPAVSISPEIVVQRNNTRYRVTVTQRDNSAQMRIKELIIEPIE